MFKWRIALQQREAHISILGAGPAGLTAAYLLKKNPHLQTTLFEADSQVGGLSKTVECDGYHFDIGGHRFFTKSEEVKALWQELLPNDFLSVARSSQIFYENNFLSYPLNAKECLAKLPFPKVLSFLSSYAFNKLSPKSTPKNYEEWMIQNFGPTLYKDFFKSYTEKVWGIPCHQISADWAAQRINKLNITEIVLSSLGLKTSSKSLIEDFLYPRKGPGQLWNECSKKYQDLGGELALDNPVQSIDFENSEWTIKSKKSQLKSSALFYSLPLGLLPKLSPGLLSSSVEKGLGSLKYRHFVTVALMGKETRVIPTQWFYIQDDALKLGRVQNYKYWSKEMVPDQDKFCLGLEFFCSEGDGYWELTDSEWTQLAKKEIESLKLFPNLDWIENSVVVRVERAYPIYDDNYNLKVQAAKEELDKISTFFPIGRNGMHRYNNQDHAMMTSMISVENYLSGTRLKDAWHVNQDAVYLEDS